MVNIPKIISDAGATVGDLVDGIGSGFAAVVDSFASVSTFGKKNKIPKKKFTSLLPSAQYQQGSSSEGAAVQNFTAAEDIEVKRQREAAFRQAAAEAEKLKWQGGSWEEKRRDTWSGQAERNLPGGGPVTYQQAILAQPMPVLSPLRGSNSPQGTRAIVDAAIGTTTASFNPALGTPGVAIPSNATAGSLDASIKVNVTNTPTAMPAGNVSSSFAAMFD